MRREKLREVAAQRDGGVRWAAFWVTGANVAALLTGLAFDFAVAGRLGASATSDAILLGISFMLFGDTLLRQSGRFSLYGAVLRYGAHEDPSARARLLGRLLDKGRATGLLIGAGTLLLAGVGGWQWGPHEAIGQLILFLPGIPPLLWLAGGIVVLGAALEARGRFMLSQLRPAFLFLPGLAAILAFASARGAWIAAAMVGGYLALFVLMKRAVAREWDFTWERSREEPDEPPGTEGRHPLNVGIGYTLNQVMRLVERFLAVNAIAGGMTLFYLAFRLISGVQTVFGLSLSTVLLPNVNRACTNPTGKSFLRLTIEGVLVTGGGGLLTAIAFQIASRAGCFTAGTTVGRLDIGELATVVGTLVWSLPAFCALPMVNGVLLALERSVPVMLGMIVFAASEMVALLAFGIEGGVLGIARCFVLAAWTSFAFVVVLLVRAWPRPSSEPVAVGAP